MNLSYVEPGSAALDEVRTLGDKNSRYLGFLPSSVFDEFASRRRILAAVVDGEVVGYVAFSPHRRLVKLVHLCVAEDFRGRGIAAHLLSRLSADYADSDGLTAHCRIDFPANTAWPKLGFVPVMERSGRSKRGSTLRVWIRRHNNPTLFSAGAPDLPRVVLDACVAFDLQDPESPKTRESKAILADWLADDFELCVTEELSHEINRNPDQSERKRRWEFASSFECVYHDRAQYADVRNDLEDSFPHLHSGSSESDLNQIAMAIAGEAQFFVTRDERLLAMGDEVTRRWGLLIVRPSELVSQSYEQRREGLYRPGRLAGTQITEARARVGELPSLITVFLAHGSGESKSGFNRIIREAAANPQNWEIQLFRGAAGDPVGLLVIDRAVEGLSQVRLIRVARKRGSDLVARHLLWHAVIRSSESGAKTILVRDQHAPRTLRPAFEPLGFQHGREGWAKVIAGGLWAPQALARDLAGLSFPGQDMEVPSRIAAVAEGFPQNPSPNSQLDLELAIWPGKIRAQSLPTFLVPIRAHWASQLFEERIAGNDLFGASPGLILNTENVYYRAARGPGLDAPARVLWYVSQATGIPHSKQVAGCSYVREVVVGSATDVFSAFDRLGVYTWKDVLAVAGGTPSGSVMAFRFSHTELFPHPIPFDILGATVRECSNTRLTVRGPRELSPECFDMLYKLGTGTE